MNVSSRTKFQLRISWFFGVINNDKIYVSTSRVKDFHTQTGHYFRPLSVLKGLMKVFCFSARKDYGRVKLTFIICNVENLRIQCQCGWRFECGWRFAECKINRQEYSTIAQGRIIFPSFDTLHFRNATSSYLAPPSGILPALSAAGSSLLHVCVASISWTPPRDQIHGEYWPPNPSPPRAGKFNKKRAGTKYDIILHASQHQQS